MFKCASTEVTHRNEEYIESHWRKGGPCDKVILIIKRAKHLAEPGSSVLWKIKIISDKVGHLAE